MDNEKKKYFLLCFLLLVCCMTGFLKCDDKDEKLIRPAVEVSDNGSVQKDILIKVYVSGAVMRPGVYDIPPNSRAEVAVKAAGGLLPNADPEKFNPAKKLKDGMQINVPVRKREACLKKRGEQAENITAAQMNNNIVSKVRTVNINTASMQELESIPGVGPAMAARIINERNKSPFRAVEELTRVKGIGTVKLEKMRPHITVE
ncbi:MAG: helix-hairpin-helix domain-containing protein [Acidaminococcaceae bacterium]|nr:helix-hairpin-helix domain-containing protein [Acidaminococcaceae bacterium]